MTTDFVEVLDISNLKDEKLGDMVLTPEDNISVPFIGQWRMFYLAVQNSRKNLLLVVPGTLFSPDPKECLFPGEGPAALSIPIINYINYSDGKGYIQDLLGALSADAREFLVSGLSPVEFEQACNELNSGEVTIQ